MEPNFKVNMNEYLPLRDVVFNTLRQAILRGELNREQGHEWRSSLPINWESAVLRSVKLSVSWSWKVLC